MSLRCNVYNGGKPHLSALNEYEPASCDLDDLIRDGDSLGNMDMRVAVRRLLSSHRYINATVTFKSL